MRTRLSPLVGLAALALALAAPSVPAAPDEPAAGREGTTETDTDDASSSEEAGSASDDAEEAPSDEAIRRMLERIDERRGAQSDYEARIYMEQKRQGDTDLVYEMRVYRRDEADKLALLFTAPKTEAGKGYLRMSGNLFMYDPTTGRWERRTDRERIGGTGSRRADFDDSSLADDYEAEWLGTAELGEYETHHLKLRAKEDADVAYGLREVWIDHDSGNLLKQQDFAVSGRLMRTSYYPEWAEEEGPDGETVWYPKRIRVFDEVEEGNQTTIVLREVDLKKLPDNLFTKAWIESKSR